MTATLELAPFRPRERAALTPTKPIPCDEWAHRRFVLAENSAEPGPVDLERLPWQRGILQAWSDPKIRKLSIQKMVQSGVTTLAEMMVAWLVDQKPTDVMWAVPTKEDVPHYQLNRFNPMVRRNPMVGEHRTGLFKDEKKRQFKFDRMSVWFRAAASKKDMSSDPCGAVVGDELDKWNQWTEDEGDPVHMLELRTSSFRKRKILLLSTPSTAHGHIHKHFKKGDQRRYWVPCPSCKKYQVLEREQLKCPRHSKGDPLKIRQKQNAWYECRHCQHQIADTQRNKDWMLRRGQWVQKGAKVDDAGKIVGAYQSDHASFQISMLYLPNAWRSWSDILAKWFEVKDDPSDLMLFVNQWLGEPWEEKSSRTTTKDIKRSEDDYDEGTVPDGVGLIVAGVDVQKDHFWVTVRGFGLELRSWLIESRRVESWGEVENRLIWGNWGGLHASLVCVDSGDGNTTFEVYEFCAKFLDVCRPTKGMSRDVGRPVQTSPIKKHWRTGKTLPHALTLWNVNTKMFKDRLSRLIHGKKGDPRRWFTHRDTSEDYRAQMSAEVKVWVPKRTGSGGEWVWKKIKDSLDNHYWDCEVLCLVAAHILGAEALREEDLVDIRRGARERREREEASTTRRRRKRSREPEEGDYMGDTAGYWDDD